MSAGIEWAGADAASSSERLSGKLKFGKAVPVSQQLSVKVIKDTREGQSMTSAAVPYTVEYVPAKPSDLVAKVTGRLLTLTGKNLGAAPMSLALGTRCLRG